MIEDIKKILEKSINAPSGSNSQPWKFAINNDRIQIFALPEKDHPVLNYNNRGTLVAIGAIIENIKIVSSEFGYDVKIEIFPEKINPYPIAEINLIKNGASKVDPLSKFVSLRVTNRKPYPKKQLTDGEKRILLDAAADYADIELKFNDKPEDLDKLGLAGSVNEIIMLENKQLHKLFFDEIVWSEKEENQRKSGLYLKTMELKGPQQMALKFFKHWPVMSFFNKFHVARAIAKDNAKTYSACSVMGAIVVRDRDEDFIKAGRLLERVWLQAISMGMNLQLITGVLFLWQNIRAGKKEIFSEEQIGLIGDAYKITADSFDVHDDKLVGLMFRIGFGDKPSAPSIKVPPVIEILQ